jgi:hypothetical protein
MIENNYYDEDKYDGKNVWCHNYYDA